jgi:hypothetical protein
MNELEGHGLPAAIFFVPAIALLIALVPLPYGYYTLLRIVVCGAAGFIAYREYATAGHFTPWVWLMVGLAVLFNPLIPIYLTREIWAPIDIFAAIMFLVYWRVRRNSKSAHGNLE